MSLLYLKLSGGALIMLSALWLSRMHCRSAWQKVDFFDGLISGFACLREQVCTCLAPIEQALTESSSSAGDASFVFCHAAKAKGSICEKFSSALEENPAALGCIAPLAQGLISPDMNVRLSTFSRISQALSEERSRMALEAKSAERLYTAAGPMIGASIIILLI